MEYLIEKYFPYPSVRKEQLEIMEAILSAINEGKDVFIEAASGIGKTIATLVPLMPYVENGHKILYLTRTHIEIDKVVTEIRRINNKGNCFRALIFKGRNTLCINEAVNILPLHFMEEACNMLKQLNACKYSSIVKGKIVPFNKLGEELILEGIEKQQCPYETILAYLKEAQILITTYNYLLINELRERIVKSFLSSSSKPPLIVMDEVHNLQELIHSVGVKLPLSDFMKSVQDLNEYYNNMRILSKLNTFMEEVKILSKYVKFNEQYVTVDLPLEEEDIVTLDSLTRSLILLKLSEGLGQVGYLARFRYFIKACLDVIYHGHHLILGRTNGVLILEVFNSNPRILKEVFKRRLAIIAMSATLSPIDLYSELLGVKKRVVKIIPSPYLENSLYILYPGICTSYKLRESSLYEKVIDLIVSIDRIIPREKSYAVFVPSHEFLHNLLDLGLRYSIDREIITDTVRSLIDTEVAGKLYLGVLGGRLSEGTDLRISLCLIVGVPYAKPTTKVMMILKEYSKIFPGKARMYAYTIPAIRKSLQAAGRVIRGPNDRGIIIFADKRYLELKKYFPKWLIPHLKIVSNKNKLLTMILSFPT